MAMKGYTEWERICIKQELTKQFPRKQIVLRKVSPLRNGGYNYKVYVNTLYLKNNHPDHVY